MAIMALGLTLSCTTDQTSSHEEEPTVDETTTTKKGIKKRDNDLSKKNLQGKVKKRTVWVYNADTTGKIDEKVLKGGVEVVYNEAGNKVTWESYDDKKELLNRWEYMYDATGNLKECKTVNGGVSHHLYHRYNPKNQLEHSEEHTDGKKVKTTTYQYNEEGYLMLSHSYFTESSTESKKKQRYNSQGQLMELEVYDEQGVVQLKKRFVYNENGQELEHAVYSGNNIPSYKRQFTYDEQGNCVKDWAYLEDGQLNTRDAFNYRYTYDKHGNWLTKTKMNSNNQSLEYHIQTLVYF